MSFFYLVSLRLNSFFTKVGSLSKFIDIGERLFWKEKLSVVLKNSLVIFVIEPKDSSFWSFSMFDYPTIQSVLSILLESVTFLHYDLFIAQPFLITFFLSFHLFLIVANNFVFFVESVRNCWNIENLGTFLFLILCHKINIFHFLELTIRDKSSWVVEPHSSSIGIQQISRPELRVFLEKSYPDKRPVLRWIRIGYSFAGIFCPRRNHPSSS